MPFLLFDEKESIPKGLRSHTKLYSQLSNFCKFFFFFLFLGPHVWHIEVPRLGVKSGLQLPTYTTATATQDLCSICNLHHSSWQHRILNPLSEARDCTHTLIDISQVPNPLSHNGNSFKYLFNDEISRHFIFHSP